MLFLSNFVNRGDIVAVNLVERCERRALVKVMKTMLSKFAYLSGEHCLRNSHVNLGQGVNSLDYSSVMGSVLNDSFERVQQQLCGILSLELVLLELLGELSRNR